MPDEISREDFARAAEKAIDEIHEHGWCQGSFLSRQGRICLESAIDRGLLAAGLLPEDSMSEGLITWESRFMENAPIWEQAETFLWDIINRLFPDRKRPAGYHLYAFNDDSRTSEEDVILVLKTLASGE